jgi:chemotaxis protein methyltransferase CheR
MEVSPQEFRDVQTLVRGLCGLVLSDDKTYLVRTRLESVVKAHGCSTFAEYLGRLQQISAVLMRDELVEALTTGETSFNRDIHPFAEFGKRILPALAETLRRRRCDSSYAAPLARIWSAGCSTGQEPYSLAMAVHDFVAAHPAFGLRPEHFPILATDVSAKSLNIAKQGRYLERDLDRGLSSDLRNRYFHKEGDYWTVNDRLRRSIEFRRLNFIDPALNFGPFEVIFCRNVMIYFDAATRQRLCDQFQTLLAPGGLLILGAAESLYGLTTSLVTETIGSTTAYRKAIPMPLIPFK